MGSSSSNTLTPRSSSPRTCSRAFWPPDSVSYGRRGAVLESVPRQRGHRLVLVEVEGREASRPVRPFSHPTSSVWWNRPTSTPAPKFHSPWVSTVGSPPSIRRKCDLPLPFGPEHRDAVAAVDLDVERLGEPGDLERRGTQHEVTGPRTLQAHVHRALGRRRRRRTGGHEALPARLGGFGPARVGIARRGPLLHEPVVLAQPLLFGLPPSEQDGLVGMAHAAGLVVGREPRRVGPRAEPLERHDRVARRR